MVELVLLFQQLIASGTHVIAKDITSSIPPPLVLFFRAMLAAFFYLAWFFISKKKLAKIERRDIPALVLLGLLNVPINQFLFLTAVELTSAPNVALGYALSPAFVMIIALFFLKEKATILKLAGIFLAFAGSVVVFFEKGIDFASDNFLGDFLVLMASLSWAFYTVIGKKYATKYGAAFVTGLSMIIGFLLYIPLFSFLPTPLQIETLSAFNWGQIVYLGIMTSCVAYFLWYWALKKMEASKLAVFNNLQPIFTTILSVIFLSYTISLSFVLGSILIISGVIMTQKG